MFIPTLQKQSLLFRDWDRIGALGILEPELKRGLEAQFLFGPFLVVELDEFNHGSHHILFRDSPVLDVALSKSAIQALCLDHSIQGLNESYEISYERCHAKS